MHIKKRVYKMGLGGEGQHGIGSQQPHENFQIKKIGSEEKKVPNSKLT